MEQIDDVLRPVLAVGVLVSAVNGNRRRTATARGSCCTPCVA